MIEVQIIERVKHIIEVHLQEDKCTLEDKCLQTQAKLQPLEQSLNQQQLGFQKACLCLCLIYNANCRSIRLYR